MNLTSNLKHLSARLWGGALAAVALSLTLACGGGGGGGGTTTPPAAKPTITSFTAAKSPITNGGSTTLTAVFSGGDTATVDNGVGAVTSGVAATVSPTTDTTYTLTVTNTAGSVTETATVAVVAAPATPVITLTPTDPAWVTTTQSFVASVPAQAGCTYTWALSGDATQTAGGGTADHTLTFTAGAVGNTVTLDCTVTNAAGTAAAAVQKSYPIVTAGNHTLAVTITGVTTADVTTTFPGHTALTATTNIDCALLTDGTYTLTANNVTEAGPVTRYPWQSSYSVTVTSGIPAVNSLTVLYPAATVTMDLPVASAPGTTTPMEFVLVPAGSFTMGAAADTWDSNVLDATPAHTVTFAHPFYVARTECTQGQWLAITEFNPSYFSIAGGGSVTDDLTRPVERVSWSYLKTAIDVDPSFLDQINAALPGHGFRLPTEAEWEYFTRAGSTTNYFFGDANTNLSSYAWWDQAATNPAGALLSNPWGLKDVLGNVWEWCEDDAHGTQYVPGGVPPTTDGSGYAGAPVDGSAVIDAPRGSARIVRGGGWSGSDDLSPRSAFRFFLTPATRNTTTGFRLVMSVPAP